MENIERLVCELCKYKEETPWLEFKHNNCSPETIGQNISALANSAAIEERSKAYVIWGVNDKTHEIEGTDFVFKNARKGQQELENWLRSLLSNNADFDYRNETINGKNVCVLSITAAEGLPVSFEKTEYIRIGSYTKMLKEYPILQSKLWQKLHEKVFEKQTAKENLSKTEALRYLDIDAYFELTRQAQPSSLENVIHYLVEDGILQLQDNGLYAISNLGAILFAKKLSDFDRLGRKAIRVAKYNSNNKYQMLLEETFNKGYAICIEELMRFLEALIPSKEVIDGAIRKTKTAYPLLALREALANALIHQDFSIPGTGPTIEIFEGKLEITNPGTMLVNVMRIIDNPPKSRNEKVAFLMRRMKMCEELGTGWDRIAIDCATHCLPAPRIDLYNESTKVTFFSKIPFSNIPIEEKLWSCYIHTCILFVQGMHLTNSSLRKRFGLNESASGTVSRLIKEALGRGLIKPFDNNTAPRYMSYVPWWA